MTVDLNILAKLFIGYMVLTVFQLAILVALMVKFYRKG